jgi:hypothetical protein
MGMPRKRAETAPAGLAHPKPARGSARRERVRRRKAEHRDKAYLAYVHTLPCVVCGVYGVEAHHQPRRSQRGWHDRLTLPLCGGVDGGHHRGKQSIHLLGVRQFEKVHGIDVPATIAAIQRAYDNRTVEPAF